MAKSEKKITIVGHFGEGVNLHNGQTIKTINLFNALKEIYGEEEIIKIDTYMWKKRPFSFLLRCIKGVKKSKNLIFLTAQNGVKVFVPLFVAINKFYNKKIFYVVVGGWLPELICKNKMLRKKINKINKIFVETEHMKNELQKLNINNTEILLNFKEEQPLVFEKTKEKFEKPFRIVYLARVIKEKGIEDAISVINEINKESKDIVFSFDIYGEIGENYKERFYNILKSCDNNICYRGCVDADKTVETLKEYFFLLFPTKFKTEGIPGTIIDAFMAGVPVIASEWNSAAEVVDDKKTGYLYNFNDVNDLKKVMNDIQNNNDITNMKEECLKKSKKYTKNMAIKTIIKEIDYVD